MVRPRDEEYYIDGRTEHVAQGDIFREVPFAYMLPEGYGGDPTLKHLTEPPSFNGYGMLINYTSGMLRGAPGTRGYAHNFRLMAPVLPLQLLIDIGFRDEIIHQLRSSDHIGYYMYLPPYPDEWPESVACPYRAVLLHHDLLKSRRVTQLDLPAAIQLQTKLGTLFLGGKWEPENIDPLPAMSDHWNPT